MNTTPDTPTKEFDENNEDKDTALTPDKVPVEDETSHFKKSEVQVIDDQFEQDQAIQVEDRFLESIAIKGRGWRRLKYVFTVVGIGISIITRYFLVKSW